MTRRTSYLLGAISLAFVLSVAGCTGCNGSGGVTPITTNVAPTVSTMAYIQTKVIDPENCNDWLSPSWKTPQEQWNARTPGQKPNAVGEGIVGFETLFDTSSDGQCHKARQDLYRLGFNYDLTSLQNLKGLVSKAELSFSTVVLPSGVSTTGLCQPVTAGGGSLKLVRPPATLPAAPSGFSDLGSGPAPAPFPADAQVFGMLFPYIPGQITQGVQTGVTVTTTPTGTGGASFTVDVTSYLNGALNRGDTMFAFMISGSSEGALTVVPPGPTDCKTVYVANNLVITHL
jgi:hypothetical protein